MKKYNVLIIGAGNQGALADAPGSGNEYKYISFAHAFRDHDKTNTIIFLDKSFKKAKCAADVWEASWTNKPISDLYVQKTFYYSIAVISTPDDTHYEILKQLAEYQLKLVICEKPLTTDLQQAREIVELYKAKGIPLMIDYTRRYIPELQELKQHGKPTLATCDFNRGWLHSASHAIDFFNMLEADNIRINEIPINSIRIWNIHLYWNNHHWQEQRIGNMPVPNYYDKHMWYVVDNAYNFLEGKESLRCTGEDALKALEICFKLMEGAK